MTFTTDFNSWKQKFIEATSKLKLNLDDASYQSYWGQQQRVAGDGMHRTANVLSSKPATEDLEAERQRTGKAEEDIIKKWENKTHPVVTEFLRLQKSHTEYLKELPGNLQQGHNW